MLTDGHTDGRKVITIAHPEQSSGELKKDKAEGHKPSETQKTEKSEKSEKEKTDIKVPDENATECLTVNDELDFTAILSGKKDPPFIKYFQTTSRKLQSQF